MKKKLKDLAKFSKGQQINSEELLPDAEFAYLNGGINPSGKWNISNVESNTITVSEGGNSCGYVNYMKAPFWCGAHCYYLFDVKCDAKYLYYALKSQETRIMQLRSGACMPNIRKNDLAEFEISFDENADKQKEIVKVLDKVALLINATNLQIAKLDELVKAKFVEMFGEYEANVLFGDICIFLRNGANIKQTKGAVGYPITRIETISNDVFNTDRMGYANVFDLDLYKNYILQKGDILISHINSVKYLGRSVQYYGQSSVPIIHGMNLLCARIKAEYNPTFVEWYLRSHRAKQYIATITKAAVNQASITVSDLKNMKLPSPTLTKQNVFDDYVEEINKLKNKSGEVIRKLHIIKQSLMQEYFG